MECTLLFCYSLVYNVHFSEEQDCGSKNTILLVEHDPVYTIGKYTESVH